MTSTGTPARETQPSGHRTRSVLVVLAAGLAVAVVAVVTTVLVLRADETSGPSGQQPAGTPVTSDTATPSPSPQPSPSRTAGPAPRPSAEQALAPFFDAATTLDDQLHAAAAAINATGPPWERITAEVARAVRNADPGPVESAVPAGLPPDLQESVVLVLSDLASRRQAMESFTVVAPVLADETEAVHQTNAQLLAELRNGHAAAVRFDGDLQAARGLAATTAPVPAVPRRSRLTAEVRVLVEYVRVANGGCDARGGAVLTTLPRVVWGVVPGQPDADGTVDGIGFSADLPPGGTWQVHLFAC